MPSSANLANKELRFALLALFPSADLRMVSEAAKCGDLDVASQFLRTALAESEAPETNAPRAAPEAAEAEPATTSDPKPSLPMQRVVDEEKGRRALDALGTVVEPDCVALDEALAAARKQDLEEKAEKQKRSTDSSQGYAVPGARTADGWEIQCQVNTERTCQSLRTLQYPKDELCTAAEKILFHVGNDNTGAFAAVCFERMLQREQDMDRDFCVFYHHYNSASLLYEVQAELARYAFSLPDNLAPLPRVLTGHFKGATLSKLKVAGRHGDHDPWFRSLGLSASPTLFAFGSEAPPLHCFRAGYGCEDLSFQGLLTALLQEALDLKKDVAEKLTAKLAEVGASYGLHVAGYGHTERRKVDRLGGQMLQIFIKKKCVTDYVYHSEPYGIPIDTEVLPWLECPKSAKKALDGQVRILFDPELFTSGKGQLFHYCGDWEFLGGDAEMKDSRASFVLALREVLRPQMSKHPPRQLQKRLRDSVPPRPDLPKPDHAEDPPAVPAAAPAKKKKDLPKLVTDD